MTARSFEDWMLNDIRVPKGIASGETEHTHPWYNVMCLTGVDYFSTLGYQPGIAFLAAGALSPLATLVLVLVTLFAALPLYRRVAQASPNGQGSIAMMEKLFPEWGGKLFILVLLGFASTDFIITMTLSAADAAAHFTANPFCPAWLDSKMVVTLLLLAGLSAIFLKGFKEAIHVAVVLVWVYLLLNAVVTAKAFVILAGQHGAFSHWRDAMFAQHSSPLAMIGVALLLFPRLALGLSGFETGVAVMPLIAGANVRERIANARKLLTTAALIMSAFLIATSVVTTLLIPAAAFKEGGAANGRAMAYLAHQYFGPAFGTAYDISTILILAFAGASAMAGLLNLIPRYLPRLGMAPEWARASRPLVLVFMGVAVVVTLAFRADVDAQGGAYATGVLVLITSGATAVTLSLWRTKMRWIYLFITAIFVYTTLVNIWERPEGLKISTYFILAIITTSLISRATRATELRTNEVQLTPEVEKVIAGCPTGEIRVVARRPRNESIEDIERIKKMVRSNYSLQDNEPLLFLEIERTDASDFDGCLCLDVRYVGNNPVLYGQSPVVANSIAAVLIEIGKRSECPPHAYFKWKDGNPVANMFRYLFFGEGDAAPLTHEVLRRAVPDRSRRPVVHVS